MYIYLNTQCGICMVGYICVYITPSSIVMPQTGRASFREIEGQWRTTAAPGRQRTKISSLAEAEMRRGMSACDSLLTWPQVTLHPPSHTAPAPRSDHTLPLALSSSLPAAPPGLCSSSHHGPDGHQLGRFRQQTITHCHAFSHTHIAVDK